MSDETIKLVAVAVVTVAQVYVMEPWKYPVFAKFWDLVARLAGSLAKILADLAMQARLNYFTAVSAYD